MPGRKKKFIDKKNAVTFHLVHRSQRDPLQADEDAPQHVLLSAAPGSKDLDTRKEKEREFGVFYDDEYDYLQHLKDVNELYEVEPIQQESSGFVPPGHPQNAPEKPRLNLPSSVFASKTETEVGMLNKAAPVRGPKLDWDPDVVAALDEDFNYDDPDNILEDDFMNLANADGPANDQGNEDYDSAGLVDSEDEEHVYKPYKPQPPTHTTRPEKNSEDGSDFASDEAEGISDDDDDLGSLDRNMFGDVETKSRFTDYSMSSSVVKRSAGLTLLDDRFEKLYEQYDDDDIGALDQEEIPGHITAESELLNSVMQEYEKQTAEVKLKDAVQKAVDVEADSGAEDDPDLVNLVVEVPKKKKVPTATLR